MNKICSYKKKVNKNVLKMIESISSEKNDEKKYNKLAKCASYIYSFNQEYCVTEIENEINKISLSYDSIESSSDKIVLFYDSFGLPYRGLINQYIDALIYDKINFIYLTYSSNKLDEEVKSKINRNALSVEYVENDFNSINYVIKIFKKCSSVLFYIQPNDILALIAANLFKGKKYLINLTDHAYWAGYSCMDYIIEFRNYGANVSHYKRHISTEKILLLPYYPISKKTVFKGYPMKNMTKDNVIFSGGSLYKTIDSSLKYYKMIDDILKENTNMFFWYAGYGNKKYLNKLIKKYKNRVVVTSEREDLNEILKNVKLYISTYPMIGGLMTQFCALNRVPCLTLMFDECSSDILNKKGEIVFEYNSIEEIKLEIHKLLNDNNYYHERISVYDSAIMINKEEFDLKLNSIINGFFDECHADFHIEYNTTRFQNTYLERIKFYDIYERIYDKKKVFLKKFWYMIPFIYFCGFLKIIEKKKNY